LPIRGEANRKKDSVVNISPTITVDKSDLIKKTGSLLPPCIKQIIEGVKLLVEPGELLCMA